MIERINLIEKEPFKFSYQKIVKIGAGLVVLCVYLFAFQLTKMYFNNKKITHLESQVITLKKEKETLLRLAPQKVAGGPLEELIQIFTQNPPWASLLSDVTNKLPSTVWLTNFKTQIKKQEKKKQETKDKNEKTSKSKKGEEPPVIKEMDLNSITLVGLAKSVADLSGFLVHLNDSPFITRPTLSNTDRKDASFTFQIECDILPITQ
ncbi:MAG: hypothetical protein A3G32_07045 [Deltaproteobacteria bacterium RIFCSPLOWO2_12_FULL_40_28]|nr:MAG: hypothetical protein A3C45_07090 [Deltaproteobacteria bacterium RIFCSPHIGHO2_02_FULL_40_28]OGQ40489.1 MAG: hypothetical protein A3I69_00345 [Deltaproteobacteria bacterium RIFCSPLOWO2_02_FULL_40_36]OGQ53725.1 MAG: hypothetical protein A3G32_07045 [Deltaproteobacteria bacterium RIFCSPLOWO2_12_FULL_40_28]